MQRISNGRSVPLSTCPWDLSPNVLTDLRMVLIHQPPLLFQHLSHPSAQLQINWRLKRTSYRCSMGPGVVLQKSD